MKNYKAPEFLAAGLIALTIILLAAQGASASMVTVSTGGSHFQISQFEVHQSLWSQVRTWALANGYEIGAGSATSPNHPISNITWYDAVKWCNAKSEMEGLTPWYRGASFAVFRKGNYGNGWQSPQVLPVGIGGNGYRLPNESEWGLAAKGGALSRGYTYSGSNDPNSVAWSKANSGGKPQPIGVKAPNELGIYDMSGNVSEWTDGFVEVDLRPSRPIREIWRRARGGDAASSPVSLQINISGTQQKSEGLGLMVNEAGKLQNLNGFRIAKSIPKSSITPTPTPTPTPAPTPAPTPTPRPSPTPSLVPKINSYLSATTKIGNSFAYQITAQNPPPSFNATGGYNASGLPPGLSVNIRNGLITGTVKPNTKYGDYKVSLSVTNQHGTGTAVLTISVVRR